jgi:membrane-associated phospholipid phosphatase
MLRGRMRRRQPETPRSAPPVTQVHASRMTVKGVLLELLGLGLALAAYYGVRLLVRNSGPEPLANAAGIYRFESAVGLDWEIALQRPFVQHLQPSLHLFNFIYAWGYWLIMVGSLGFLYVRHHSLYAGLRNAMIVSGLIGFLIFASFPTAPPRLMNVGIADTVQFSSSILEEVARPSALTNQQAAMPSLHFGWILLCGVYLSIAFKRRVGKALALLLPALMGLTIIVTGNHFVLDAIVGGVVSLVALAPVIIQRRHPEKKPYQLQRV